MSWYKYPDTKPKDGEMILFSRCCQEHDPDCFCRGCHEISVGTYDEIENGFSSFDGLIDVPIGITEEYEEHKDTQGNIINPDKIYNTVIYWMVVPVCPWVSKRIAEYMPDELLSKNLLSWRKNDGKKRTD